MLQQFLGSSTLPTHAKLTLLEAQAVTFLTRERGFQVLLGHAFPLSVRQENGLLAGFVAGSKRGHLSVQTLVAIFAHRHASRTPCMPARMPFEQFSTHPDHSGSANTRRYTLHPDATGEVLQAGTAYLACTVKATDCQRSARRAVIFLSDADDRPKLWNVELRLEDPSGLTPRRAPLPFVPVLPSRRCLLPNRPSCPPPLLRHSASPAFCLAASGLAFDLRFLMNRSWLSALDLRPGSNSRDGGRLEAAR